MGHRLSKIYTRTGDQGTTGLGNGQRVDKDDPRVEAFGAVDELNSVIAMVLAHDIPDTARACLTYIQHNLFDLGGELCIPGHCILRPRDVMRLEEAIDSFNTDLPHLKEFVLPGGGQAAATCHLARAVCRRAERRIMTLTRHETINNHAMIYLNRLSDLLFVLARVLAREHGEKEVLWQRSWN